MRLYHPFLLVVGCLMIWGGFRARRTGYINLGLKFTRGLRLGQRIYYRDKNPIMFRYCVVTHIAGGFLVIVLALLAWGGFIDISRGY